MDNTIREGDLVVVVGPTLCCSNPKQLGHIGIVSDVRKSWTGDIECTLCKKVHVFSGLIARIPTTTKYKSDFTCGWIELTRLKKIPPLREPESIDESREVTA